MSRSKTITIPLLPGSSYGTLTIWRSWLSSHDLKTRHKYPLYCVVMTHRNENKIVTMSPQVKHITYIWVQFPATTWWFTTICNEIWCPGHPHQLRSRNPIRTGSTELPYMGCPCPLQHCQGIHFISLLLCSWSHIHICPLSPAELNYFKLHI